MNSSNAFPIICQFRPHYSGITPTDLLWEFDLERIKTIFCKDVE